MIIHMGHFEITVLYSCRFCKIFADIIQDRAYDCICKEGENSYMQSADTFNVLSKT